MELTPYLSFDGTCGEAFAHYARALGGTIVFSQTFKESPMAGDVPAEWGDKIMHTTLKVAGFTLMGADAPPSHFATPQGFSLSIGTETPEEAERLFNAMAEGGNVTMPFQKTFWSSGFGMVIDRFGIPWMVNCSQQP